MLDETKACCLYVRVSSGEQHTEMQERAGRAFAQNDTKRNRKSEKATCARKRYVQNLDQRVWGLSLDSPQIMQPCHLARRYCCKQHYRPLLLDTHPRAEENSLFFPRKFHYQRANRPSRS